MTGFSLYLWGTLLLPHGVGRDCCCGVCVHWIIFCLSMLFKAFTKCTFSFTYMLLLLFFLHLLHWIIYVRFVVSQVMWCLICLVSLFVGESVWCFSIVNLCIGGWHYLTKTHKKSCEFTQGNFTRFSCLIHQIFMAKTKGIFMGSTYENTIKKAMKILLKIHN